VVVLTNVLGFIANLPTLFHSILISLGFIKKEIGLLVNISVAELQSLNVFSQAGIRAIVGRIGFLPTLLTLLAFPIFIFYKMLTQKVQYVEVFLLLWTLTTFWMITNGIRFAIQFSSAAAVTAGYMIGKFIKFFRRGVFGAFLFGLLLLLTLHFISNAMQIGFASRGMEISKNWIDGLDWLKASADKNSLIATWWDPGHIITGYTGLKVHADGAHCSPVECIPYNHNIRIRDMGKIFLTSKEEEALEILKKYKGLSKEQCELVKKAWGEKIPEDACEPVSEIYLIASSDLIGKYYWLSCFGSFDMETRECKGKVFWQVPFKQRDEEGRLIYEAPYGLTKFLIILTQKDGNIISIVSAPHLGIHKGIAKQTVLYQEGQEFAFDYEGEDAIDAMVWIDPSFRLAIFMEKEVRDSLFTQLFFFDGKGLKNFELVYSNPELKIFKVKF
jgi:hypothetical protein